MKDFQQKNQNGELSDNEWEKMTQNLLNAKFDKVKEKEVEGILAKNGIYRTKRKSFFQKNWMAMAASFLLLVSVGGYFLTKSLSSSKYLALQQLETPYDYESNRRGGDDNIQKTRGKAIEAYDNNQHEKALDYLQEIESQGKIEMEDYFLMGLCLIYKPTPDYKNALEVFEKVRSFNKATFINETNWFSALCCLMIDDKEQAKFFIQKVVNSPSSRKNKEAQRILEKIK